MNGVIYSSFQTKFVENTWANHVYFLWSGVIDYYSFSDASFNSLRTEFALNTLSLPVFLWFGRSAFWAATRFPEAICPRYCPVFYFACWIRHMVLAIVINWILILDVSFLVLILVSDKVASSHNESHNFLYQKNWAPIF